MKFRHVRSLFPSSLSFKGCPSLTRQEFVASSDMNYIVSKFLRTGQINLPNVSRPMVDGLEYPNDFTDACNVAFEQRNLEVARNEQEALALQTESSGVSSSTGVSGGAQTSDGQNSQMEQQEKAI